jgi:hypothetical protein
MAQTGKSYIPFSPSNRNAGQPRVRTGLEASVQTFVKGAPLFKSTDGFIHEGESIPQTIWGFARVAGQNGASDGAKTSSAYVAEVGKLYVGTLAGTLTQSHNGAKAQISKSASSWLLSISTAASASYNAVIEGWTSAWDVADVLAEVMFSVIGSKIQGDV